MNKFVAFPNTLVTFSESNLGKVIVVVVSIVFSYFAYILTSSSLKKLKPDIISYYPFDKFFPRSGSWSAIYFLITIILVGMLVYFFAKGEFYLAPA